jgi:hypothetical protein
MRWISVLYALALASSAAAQTHPCDEPPQTTAQKGSKLGFCHDLKDAEGFGLAVPGFVLYIDTQPIDLGSSLTPIGNPSSTGLYYFEVSLPTNYSRGIYSVWLVAYNVEGQSSPSPTIQWQIGGPPTSPKGPRVK